jgi:sugar phosphate isomerase/epimerase
MLGPHLCEVHLKDRTRDGLSVRLGQGDADFGAFFNASAEVGYQGPLIVEAPVDEEPITAAMADLAFLKRPQ